MIGARITMIKGLKWKYRPRRREMIFFLVWMAAGLILLAKTTAVRVIADSRRLNAEIDCREERLAKLKGLLAGAGKIDSEYRRLAAKGSGRIEPGSLIQGIESTARKAGVNLVSLKPVQFDKKGGEGVNALRVDLQDDLYAIALFFSLINEELNGAGVEQVQLSVRNREEPPVASFIITAGGEDDQV